MHKYEIGVARETGEVMIRFEVPTRDVLLTPELAIELAAYLIKHAKASPLYKPPNG